MAYNFGTKLKIYDLDELKTTKGTSWIIYNASATRKTRVTGTLPGVTVHLVLDNGSNSANEASDLLEIGGTHKAVPIAGLHELNEAILTLHTSKDFLTKVDNVVIDNMVAINSDAYHIISNLPRYKKDMLHISDVVDSNPDKNAESKKMMPMYGDIQKVCYDLVRNMLELKENYNVLLLADEGVLTPTGDNPPVHAPILMPKINGPRSVKPVCSLFDEIYRTKFKAGEFDSKEGGIKTKFTLSTSNDPATGIQVYSKTRNIKNIDWLAANEMPADFRLIFKEIGYIIKSDRKKK